LQRFAERKARLPPEPPEHRLEVGRLGEYVRAEAAGRIAA
jgi:hypothetical protein